MRHDPHKLVEGTLLAGEGGYRGLAQFQVEPRRVCTPLQAGGEGAAGGRG